MHGLSIHTEKDDVGFKIIRIPAWRAYFYQFLSVNIWGKIPSSWQRNLSYHYTRIYTASWSRYIIKPYIAFHYQDHSYLQNFKPPKGKSDYTNFQDFFIRELSEIPKSTAEYVWPCEGLVCDQFKLGDKKVTSVKGDSSEVHHIFGVEDGEIPHDYHFANVFLHNKNYHRIHAPVCGTITRIQHIKGDLVVLRPWIYKKAPSLPAFRNERVNIDIEDKDGKTWYLSIVGGPAVGTIELPRQVALGQKIEQLNELAVFYLGSTCCIASPRAPIYTGKNYFVKVGASY